MLREAEHAGLAPKVESMTLVQEFETSQQLAAHDTEIATYRNQRWQMVSETVNTVLVDVSKLARATRHVRIIRLERPAHQKPIGSDLETERKAALSAGVPMQAVGRYPVIQSIPTMLEPVRNRASHL